MPNSKFRKFCDSIPHGRYDDFRLRVIAECNIKDSTFRVWYGGFNVPEERREVINRIALEMFNKKVF